MNDKLVYWSIPKEFIIVQCKDCKYKDNCKKQISIRDYDEELECNYMRFERLTSCSYGERKIE